MHFARGLRPVILGPLPSAAHKLPHRRTHIHHNAGIPSLPVLFSIKLLMQKGLGILTNQEDTIHNDTHIIKSTHFVNYSTLQIYTQQHGIAVICCVCVCVCVCKHMCF